MVTGQIGTPSRPSASPGQGRTPNPAQGCGEPEIQATFCCAQASCLAQGCVCPEKRHHCDICRASSGPSGPMWKVSCFQGLPRPRAPRKEDSDPSPELDKVWSLLRVWPCCPGLGWEKAGDVPEPVSGWGCTGQAAEGQGGIPGSGRMCPAQDSLLGRSKEAAEVGGSRKPECPLAGELHFPAALS